MSLKEIFDLHNQANIYALEDDEGLINKITLFILRGSVPSVYSNHDYFAISLIIVYYEVRS